MYVWDGGGLQDENRREFLDTQRDRRRISSMWGMEKARQNNNLKCAVGAILGK